MAPHIYNDIAPHEDESHQAISSYFLGPRAENYEYFKKNILEILDGQRDARLDYFPRDGKFVTEEVQASTVFRNCTRKVSNAVRQAARLLGKHSIPFWSPRYQGHMCMDLSMPALLGYFMTMIYNPNNVSIEASPFTTVAEMTTGGDLCRMFGYNVDPNNTDLPLAWGHIVCGGSVANLESVWVTRNLKFYPLSIRSAMKKGGPLSFIAPTFEIETCLGVTKLMKDLTKWELLNLKSKEVLDIPEKLHGQYHISPTFLNTVMQDYGIQSTGKGVLEEEFGVGPMKYLVSNTRHYSWPKAAAVVGLGSDSMVGVKVDHGARMDLDDLRGQLQYCLDKQVAVYAVVAIIGSTEEGAVDPLRGVIKMRDEFQAKGLSFLVHCDGAWGGYFCTMLPQDYRPGQEINLPSEKGFGEGFVPDSSLRADTQENLFMIRQADSITIDPHKAAYIPYPAGGLCYRDGRLRYLITWTSPVISRGETSATSIGVFGIEGSKPGASVMSTWFSNICIGMGPDGYGKLLSEVTFTCSRLSAEWAAMSTKDDNFIVVPLNELPSELKHGTPEEVEAEKQKIRDRILQKTNSEIVSEDESRPKDDKALALLQALGSDLNINSFSTNWRYEDGTLNDDVEEANYFNLRVIQRLSVDSPEDDPTKIPFFLTSTTFMVHEYGECVQHFKKRLGLYEDQENLAVMRNVVMSPWPTDGNFIARLTAEFKKVLDEEVQVCRERNDVSPTHHEFLLQGTERTYIIHFPMFYLEKHRHQLIIEVKLPDAAMAEYKKEKEADPTGSAFFTLETEEDLALAELVAEKKPFKASVIKKKAPEKVTIATDVLVSLTAVVKDRSLKGRYRDTSYPTIGVPFYLYGTPTDLSIDHILVRAPNIQLSADNVSLSLDKAISADALSKGAILLIHGYVEDAMQPFQSSEGPLGDTLAADSEFFFTPGREFTVSVYEDAKGAGQPGPGILNVAGNDAKLIGKGKMKLGQGRALGNWWEHQPYEYETRFPLYASGRVNLSTRQRTLPSISLTSAINLQQHHQKMSSPAPRRSRPASVQGTPQNTRQNVQSSSPLFYQSSPAAPNGNPNGNGIGNVNMDISSPLKQVSVAGSTPRALPGDSSPIRYASSSSPTRAAANGDQQPDIPSSSSGLFVRSSRSSAPGTSGLNNSRRGDIHSDVFGSTPGRRRRLFVDENGVPVRDGGPSDPATFSNLDPNTSEADAIGGSSTRIIWGTNISIQDTMSTFKEFLLGYQKKYRMWADGATDEETSEPGSGGNEREYVEMLNNMRQLGVTGLNLDVRNLKAFPSTVKLWHQLQAYPHEIVPLMDQAIKDIIVDQAEEEMNRMRSEQQLQRAQARPDSSMPAVPSSETSGHVEQQSMIPDLVQEAETKVYKVKPFGLDSSVNMRELNPNDMDKMVSIKGLVIRTTPVIPDMKTAFFRCQVCNHAVNVSLDRGKIAEPTRCPRQACESQNSMQIVHNRCEFADKQVIKLQETPDSVPDGQTPHSVSLCAYEELVDVCKAGDRIEVTGIFRSNPVRINPRQRTIKALFKTYIDVLHIQKVDKRRLGIDVSTVEQELSDQVAGDVDQTRKISEEEEQKIKATAARGDIYELLARSLAPSVYEMDDVKKGILLQLFGGTNKSFEKGGSPKYRGDINVLLCGDPSTSKSQLLKYVHRIAPRGVYTSGKGSSAVGLTAYVSRDPETRQVVLESGALVLSDGGVCCIDEFDKMSDSTRSVLHEVMEQQTVSIAKAGIITTLNARTSILASANPIGSKYNVNLPVPQNIDLPPTLLSRFDLVYLVLDHIDEQMDRRLARHLVGMYLEDTPENGNAQEVLPVEFLTSYISYARTTCQPKITQAASEALVAAYVQMRKLGEDVRAAERRITATTRQLESMIRLAEAHAKMRLADEVTANDVNEAVRLIKSALKQAATDARTGLIDMGLLTEGTSASERRRKSDLKKAITDLLDEMTRSGGSARYSEVYRRVGELGSAQVEGTEFAEALRSLEQEGQVVVGGEGPRRNIRRVTGVS